MDIVSIKKELKKSALNYDISRIESIFADELFQPLESPLSVINLPFIEFLHKISIYKKPLLKLFETKYQILYGYFLRVKHPIFEELIKQNNSILVEAVKNYIIHSPKVDIYKKNFSNTLIESIIPNISKFEESLITFDLRNLDSYKKTITDENKVLLTHEILSTILDDFAKLQIDSSIMIETMNKKLLLSAISTTIATKDYLKNIDKGILESKEVISNDSNLLKFINYIISKTLQYQINNILLHNYYLLDSNYDEAFRMKRIPATILPMKRHPPNPDPSGPFYTESYTHYIGINNFFHESIFPQMAIRKDGDYNERISQPQKYDSQPNQGMIDNELQYQNNAAIVNIKEYYYMQYYFFCLNYELSSQDNQQSQASQSNNYEMDYNYLDEMIMNTYQVLTYPVIEFNRQLLINNTGNHNYNSINQLSLLLNAQSYKIPTSPTIKMHNSIMVFEALEDNRNKPSNLLGSDSKLTDSCNLDDIDCSLFSILIFNKYSLIDKSNLFNTFYECLLYYIKNKYISDIYIVIIIRNLLFASNDYLLYKEFLKDELIKPYIERVLNDDINYMLSNNDKRKIMDSLS